MATTNPRKGMYMISMWMTKEELKGLKKSMANSGYTRAGIIMVDIHNRKDIIL